MPKPSESPLFPATVDVVTLRTLAVYPKPLREWIGCGIRKRSINSCTESNTEA